MKYTNINAVNLSKYVIYPRIYRNFKIIIENVKDL